VSEKYQILNLIKNVIRFEHPNLCKYYDVAVLETQNVMGETERVEVGILEYLDGGDIRKFVAQNPKYTDRLLVDILKGLSYLHKKGMVHGT
jgi:serine/threonine protein kinase